MTDYLQHVAQSIQLDFDIVKVAEQINEEIGNQNLYGKNTWLDENQNRRYWNRFDSGNLISKSLQDHWPELAESVILSLKEAQSKTKPNGSYIVDRWLEHRNFDLGNLWLLTNRHQPVLPHVDRARGLAVQFGVVNSNNAVCSYVPDNQDLNNYNPSDAKSYQLNDGDVAIFRPDCIHWIDIVNPNLKRYIFSYTFVWNR